MQEPCARRGCNTLAHRCYFLPSRDKRHLKITYVVNLCQDCRDTLMDIPVHLIATHVGTLHFVEEIWTPDLQGETPCQN